MLLPMPSMPMQIGPPTQYALNRRPFLLLLLVLQAIVCVMRMVVLLDVMGGFIMAITIGLGVYGWKEHMNITFISYWGMLSFINGVFDAVKALDYAVKLPVGLFSSTLPDQQKLLHGVLLAVPLIELIGCPLAYWLHQDYVSDDVMQENSRGGEWGGAAPNYGSSERAPLGQGVPVGQPNSGGPAAGGNTGGGFQAFAGSGQRLGA
eukprot:TRINITY_DN117591_c0_g1_i1.p1 TRINITY_DN117591_c0_g1~~TRINITY_DN117591_c0_g1_i1.p1  ORF type:complete len:206 (+),score=19.52 TRINITY_DN117591_c0_g1_i1:142-759(+)